MSLGLQGLCMFDFCHIDFAFVKNVLYRDLIGCILICIIPMFIVLIVYLPVWPAHQSLKRMPSELAPFSSFSKMILVRPLLPSCWITTPQASPMINTPLSAAKSHKKFSFSWNQLIVIIILQWWLKELMGGLKVHLGESSAHISLWNWVWSFHVLHLAVLKICYQSYSSFAAGRRAVNGPLESLPDFFFFLQAGWH